MKRKIILAIVIVIVVAAIIGYRMYSMQTEDVVNKAPDARITAKELVEAFEKDTATASRRYLDKIVEVSGSVRKIDAAGSVILGEDGTEAGVVFDIDRRHLEDLQKIAVGGPATLQGKCTGYSKEEMMGVDLGTTVTISFAGVKSND